MINAIEEKNDQMVEDIVNSLPYYKKKNKTQSDLLPIDDKIKKTLNIMSSFIEQELEFLDKLADKKDIKLPGKDNILPKVDIIALNNILKLSNEELEGEIKKKSLRSLQ